MGVDSPWTGRARLANLKNNKNTSAATGVSITFWKLNAFRGGEGAGGIGKIPEEFDFAATLSAVEHYE